MLGFMQYRLFRKNPLSTGRFPPICSAHHECPTVRLKENQQSNNEKGCSHGKSPIDLLVQHFVDLLDNRERPEGVSRDTGRATFSSPMHRS